MMLKLSVLNRIPQGLSRGILLVVAIQRPSRGWFHQLNLQQVIELQESQWLVLYHSSLLKLLPIEPIDKLCTPRENEN